MKRKVITLSMTSIIKSKTYIAACNAGATSEENKKERHVLIMFSLNSQSIQKVLFSYFLYKPSLL